MTIFTRPTVRNTAFFSVCNDDYIPKSITSLLSIRKILPRAKLFVISRSVSTQNTTILNKLNINIIDIDLRGKFNRQWDYPTECYYFFAGPELLLKCGFKYSVYIDGDVLCINNPLKSIKRINGIAGFPFSKYDGVFLKDTLKIQQLFNISDAEMSKKRIQSGIVYFNNIIMTNKKLCESASNLFKQCLSLDIPRKGDDSLFALLQLVFFLEEEKEFLEEKYNYSRALDNKNNPHDLIFIHFLDKKPWDKAHNPNQYQKQWLEIYNMVLSQYPIKKSNAVNNQINYKAIPERAYNANSKKEPIRIFISEDKEKGIFNFGDELPKYLIPSLFNYKIIPCDNIADAELFSVGSILSGAQYIQKKPFYCWGSGFISEEAINNEQNVMKSIIFTAIRGKLSYERIQPVHPKKIPFGDPGILTNLIFPASQRQDLIGVVPHYVDVDHPVVEKLRNDKRFLIINPMDSPREVARQISSCRFVFSSSLHGLIFSDSYKIPNAHVVFSDKVYGGEYKFHDYDSGVGKKHLDADYCRITDFEYIRDLEQKYKPIKDLEKRQQALIDAFPKIH